MEKLYTTEEAREYLKISYPTIQRYIKSGKLKSQKLGRQYRITESALNEFMSFQNEQRGRKNDE